MAAINGPILSVDDIALADAMVQLTHEELESFGTGRGSRVSDDEMKLLLRACHSCCMRIGVEFPSLPFRTLSGFREYWKSKGYAYSYQARRDYLNQMFKSVEEALMLRADVKWFDQLAHPVTPHLGTGWSLVDAEIHQLRTRFLLARTEQDHAAVGTACVRVLELLGDMAFDPSKHSSDQSAPPRDKTKARFEAVISHELAGSEHELLRKLARATVEVAHQVKHRKTPDRRDAGIAADSVILLTNIIRRITMMT